MLIRSQLMYLCPLSYNVSMLLTQLSAVAVYKRLSSPTLRGQIVCYIIAALATLNACSGVIVNYILKQRSGAERDHGLVILWYINSGLSLPLDFAIWFLPIPMLVGLKKLDKFKKIGLLLTFSIGLLCPGTALGRLCVVKQAGKFGGDLAWNLVYVHVLTTAEVGVAICALSMLCLRQPLVQFQNWCKRSGSERCKRSGSETSLCRTKSVGLKNRMVTRACQTRSVDSEKRIFENEWIEQECQGSLSPGEQRIGKTISLLFEKQLTRR